MQAISVVQPKTPSGKKWQEQFLPAAVTLGYPGIAFFHKPSRLFVISAVESGREDLRMEAECCYFHISVSKKDKGRCSPEEAQFVLQAFGMEDAEEDNHVPNGMVRNFWRPVAENRVGRECACKEQEPAVVEDRGSYVWRAAQ